MLGCYWLDEKNIFFENVHRLWWLGFLQWNPKFVELCIWMFWMFWMVYNDVVSMLMDVWKCSHRKTKVMQIDSTAQTAQIQCKVCIQRKVQIAQSTQPYKLRSINTRVQTVQSRAKYSSQNVISALYLFKFKLYWMKLITFHFKCVFLEISN